jgi:RND family efflux transporter MFP subunit
MKLNSEVLQASLETVLARHEFAKREVQRNADLYNQNLISEHEQDEMLTEKNLAEFQVKEAQIRLRERETRSPISGIVVKRYKKPGEYVDETPIMRVVSLIPLHAEVVIQADMYGQITKNSKVSLYIESSTSRHKGIIKTIDPIIDAASNTFAITIELNNSKRELIAGSRCRVEFTNK